MTHRTVLAAAALFTATACTSGGTDSGAFRVRKDAKDLSAEEKLAFTDAILALKASPPPEGVDEIVVPGPNGVDVTLTVDNWYDMFVIFHQAAVMQTQNARDGAGVAHHNPSFPPWHRKLLLDYEDALRTVSGEDITLPYWDWTNQESTDAVFSPDLMGGFGSADCAPDCKYAVMDGPFAKGSWALTIPTQMPSYEGQHPFTWIVRAEGVHQNVTYEVALPSEEEVAAALAIDAYDAAPFDMTVDRMGSFRNYLEGFNPPGDSQHMHNIGHDWVSGGWIETITEDGVDREQTYVGTMEPLDISPSDPVFFMHHSNVDRVWASWQEHEDGRLDAYEPVTGDWPDGWKRDDQMYPFRLFPEVPEVGGANTPGDFLDTEALGYGFDELVQ